MHDLDFHRLQDEESILMVVGVIAVEILHFRWRLENGEENRFIELANEN